VCKVGVLGKKCSGDWRDLRLEDGCCGLQTYQGMTIRPQWQRRNPARGGRRLRKSPGAD